MVVYFVYGNRRSLFFSVGHVAFSCAVVGIDSMRAIWRNLLQAELEVFN